MNEPRGPDKCPITGLPFFMNIEHPELGMIATYGGPFDSYTIPAADDDDEGCFRSERYDHDMGGWVEGGEPWPIHRLTADEFVEHYEWRDQRDEWKKQCDFASEAHSAAAAENSRLTAWLKRYDSHAGHERLSGLIGDLEALRDRVYLRLQCADVPRDPWHWEVSAMLVMPDTALTPAQRD